MKNIVSLLTGTGAALAIAAAIFAPIISSADEIKGAQLLTAPVAAGTSVAAASMNCASCKDGLKSRIDTSVRGAMKPVVIGSVHGCGSCSTSVKTVGTGKAAKDVVDHSCAMGSSQMASCCN